MNYVTVFDEVIPPDKCDYFIDKFENDTDAQEIQDNSHGATLSQIRRC